MGRENQVPRYLAIHEAAHAVASWAMQVWLGWSYTQFHAVVVRTPEECRREPTYLDEHGDAVHCAGIVETPRRYQIGISRLIMEQHPTMADMIRQGMEADIVELLAGSIAEARFRHIPMIVVILGHAETDWKGARRIASDYCRGDRAAASQLINKCEAHARQVVREHWPRIERLADALVKHHRLDADEAQAIVEGADASGSDKQRKRTQPAEGGGFLSG
jgi:hypothetical protein